ncbi:MAG: hypothetical protein ACOYO0_14235, partial [Sandarakinorhabdus sp.]
MALAGLHPVAFDMPILLRCQAGRIAKRYEIVNCGVNATVRPWMGVSADAVAGWPCHAKAAFIRD